MKKYLLFILILFIIPIYGVKATSISNIDMNIFIDKDGSAKVTETWTANVTDGTEGYHPYYNLGNATITDLSVTMDGKQFETISTWNVNNTFNEKANKAGFYHDGDELDICFGITSYGPHTYVIKYTIVGFVVKLADADMVYWNLFPKDFSAEPGNVNIKIYSDFKYEDTLDVWGYGKYGALCYVYDGRIEMTSDNSTVTSDEYMTILVKFPKDTFVTDNVLDQEFDYYHNMAEDGAINYNDNTSIWSKIGDFVIVLFPILINIFVWGMIIFVAIISGRKNNNLDFGTTGNKVRKDVPNFREIPCNKDIFRAYWVSNGYKLNKKKEDFLGTVLLKWLRNGNVKIEKVESKKLFKTNVDDNIIFNQEPEDANEYEKNLYRWMLEASKDGKLEKNEFKNWCSSHYSKILKWFDDVIDFESKMLVNEGKATAIQTGKVFKSIKYQIDSSMMLEAEQMAGLKNFLKEFTLIKEREPIEVSLWDEYLMYAQIFGIADEVASQFKKLYPDIVENMQRYGFGYDDIIFIHMVSSDGIKSASAAKSRARSYNAGGGGFSSGGGGFGSFGGGGGGGGFR